MNDHPMKEHPILGYLLSKFDLVRPIPQAQAEKPGLELKASKNTLNKDLNQFKTSLNSVLWQRQSDIGDRLFLVRLDRVKEKMGERWGKSQANIHQRVRQILDQKLTPQDLHIQYDEIGYLIIFGSIGKEEGKLKTSIIAEEIAQQLVGAETASSFVDVKTLSIDNSGDVTMSDIPKIQDLLDDVLTRFNQVPNNMAMPHDLDSHPDSGISESRLNEVEFIFRPLLAVNTKVISTFLCVPVLEISTRHFESNYDVLGRSNEPRLISDLDLLSVKKISGEFRKMDQKKRRSLLALPVHFETLADAGYRRKFSTISSSLLKDHASRIVFELAGLPDGIPQPRLIDLVAVLRPFSRAVIALFPPERTNFAAFRAAGLHAVGIDLFDTQKSEAALMRDMTNFVHSAKTDHLKTYAQGIRTISLLTAALSEGFDYVAGYALSPVIREAEDIQAYQLDMPYLPLLDTAPQNQEGQQDQDSL